MNVMNLLNRLSSFKVLMSNWVLFSALVALLFVCPFFWGNLQEIVFDLLVTLVILLSVFATAGEKSKRVLIGFGLTILAVWLTRVISMPNLNFLLRLVVIIYFITIVFKFINLVSKREEVGGSVMVEAVNGYLLMGLGFSFLVNFVNVYYPDVFSFQAPLEGEIVYDPIYFSFVTMTTLGYGDLLPLGQAGKAIALVITLSGQFYLVTIMAFLVGKLLARKND
jgi:hypothetical protein